MTITQSIPPFLHSFLQVLDLGVVPPGASSHTHCPLTYDAAKLVPGPANAELQVGRTAFAARAVAVALLLAAWLLQGEQGSSGHRALGSFCLRSHDSFLYFQGDAHLIFLNTFIIMPTCCFWSLALPNIASQPRRRAILLYNPSTPRGRWHSIHAASQ
eukprot:scaffold11178_cov23-Tisochrysis_lutea.AAC.2